MVIGCDGIASHSPGLGLLIANSPHLLLPAWHSVTANATGRTQDASGLLALDGRECLLDARRLQVVASRSYP